MDKKLKIVCLIGEPATGKSTVAKAVIKRLSDGNFFKERLLFGTYHWRERVYVLGKYEPKERFPGTDRLSMGVQPEADFWIRVKAHESPPARVFFEGDRLGSLSFLQTCKQVADLEIFVLTSPMIVKAARHRSRGDNQTERFLKGRQTKIANICKAFPGFKILKNDEPEDVDVCADKLLKSLIS